MSQALLLYHQARQAWQQGDLTKAKEHYQQAIAVDPNLPDAYYELACLLQDQETDDLNFLAHLFCKFVKLSNPIAEELRTQRLDAKKRMHKLGQQLSVAAAQERAQLFQGLSQNLSWGYGVTKGKANLFTLNN